MAITHECTLHQLNQPVKIKVSPPNAIRNQIISATPAAPCRDPALQLLAALVDVGEGAAVLEGKSSILCTRVTMATETSPVYVDVSCPKEVMRVLKAGPSVAVIDKPDAVIAIPFDVKVITTSVYFSLRHACWHPVDTVYDSLGRLE